jgi:hypothetical protein
VAIERKETGKATAWLDIRGGDVRLMAGSLPLSAFVGRNSGQETHDVCERYR